MLRPMELPRHAVILAWALAGLAALGGCGSVPAPSVLVESAQVTRREGGAAVLEFDVLAQNRSPTPLPLARVRYRVFLDGREVFNGERSAEATLSNFGVARLALPAGLADDPGAVTADYRLEGEVEFLRPEAIYQTLDDAGWYRPGVPFAAEGRVDMARVEERRRGPARDLAPIFR
jgi:hypothetical protein